MQPVEVDSFPKLANTTACYLLYKMCQKRLTGIYSWHQMNFLGFTLNTITYLLLYSRSTQ